MLRDRGVHARLAYCLNSVLNVKAVVAAFNKEKALVGAFSHGLVKVPNISFSTSTNNHRTVLRGVAASRFVGRQDLMAYKGLVLTLGSMITIPMVWSM